MQVLQLALQAISAGAVINAVINKLHVGACAGGSNRCLAQSTLILKPAACLLRLDGPHASPSAQKAPANVRYCTSQLCVTPALHNLCDKQRCSVGTLRLLSPLHLGTSSCINDKTSFHTHMRANTMSHAQ
jgi:hypothetical protein